MVNLCFYHPSKNIGGVQVLFSTISNSSLARKKFQTMIIDYPDGYMAINKIDDVKLIAYSNHVLPVVPDNAILVIQADLMLNIHQKLVIPKNTKILVWYLHPLNLKFCLPFYRNFQIGNWQLLKILSRTIFYFDYRKAKLLLEMSHKRKSLLFMDGSTFDIANSLIGFSCDQPNFCPVVLNEHSPKVINRNRDKKNALRLCYIGRVDRDFKLEPLKKSLDDAERFSSHTGRKITFEIIGEGEGLESIKTLSFRYISLVFTGSKPLPTLSSHIKQKADIIFAMGMSALEGAKSEIPTVCLDASYSPVAKNYKYRWIQESEDYSLGYIIRDGFIPKENTMSFADLINNFDLNQKVIASAGMSYYQDVYDPSANLNNFLNHVNSSSFSFSELEEVNKNLGIKDFFSFYKRVFS